VRNLALFNLGVIALIVSYAWVHGMSFREMIPLILTAVLTSIPVALPATFTLAAVVEHEPWRNGGSSNGDSRQWMKAATMDYCASTRPARSRERSGVVAVRSFDGAR